MIMGSRHCVRQDSVVANTTAEIGFIRGAFMLQFAVGEHGEFPRVVGVYGGGCWELGPDAGDRNGDPPR